MATQNKTELIKKISQTISNVSVDASRSGFNQLINKKSSPYYKLVNVNNTLLNRIAKFDEANFEKVPLNRLFILYNSLNDIRFYLDGLKGPQSNYVVDPSDAKELIEGYTSTVSAFIDTSDAVLFISKESKATTGEALVSKKKLDQLIAAARTYEKEASKSNEEIKSLLSSAKQSASEIGVARFATIFEDAAKLHNRKAKWWLGGTFLSLAILISYSVVLFYWQPIPSELTEQKDRTINDKTVELLLDSYIIQYTLAKVMLLTAILYSFAVCNRNFKAHKHNNEVNLHRQHSLDTFETFVKSVRDQDSQIKDAILMETTRAIFTERSTGFLNQEKEQDSVQKIIEILKPAKSNS